MKTCTKCKINKSKSEFLKDTRRKDGLQSNCKVCHREAKRRWQATPEGRTKQNEGIRRYMATSKGKLTRKNNKLKHDYDITLDQYNDMLRNQGEVCAICDTNKPGGKFKYFHVDHDHKTGEIRGLLCCGCNHKLGWFEKFKNNLYEYGIKDVIYSNGGVLHTIKLNGG